jgi:ceramide glucosyltransferase
MLATVVSTITTVLALAGLGYYILALWSARAFGRKLREPQVEFAPPVSILKPVKGLDREMYEAFVSHCRQQYAGEVEILFGVSSLDDPAVAAVGQLREEFPGHTIRLVECPELLGTNGKVSNLVQMLPHARYQHVLINDSDIRVSPRYLARIMAGFAAPAHGPERKVGMVTAPYRGRAHGTVGSKMEALGIATDFIAGVLTARMLEGGIRFGLGSTLALSREALAAIGGLLPVVDHLADDYELGARVASAGFDVALSGEVVETFVPAYTFRHFLKHQIRWSRSTRDSRKWGYTGLLFTFGLPWALLNLLASGLSLESFALFVLALLGRTALALTVGVGVLGDRQVLRDLWLLVPRDVVALGLWIWSFAGDTVSWRGQRFALKDGKLSRLPV